MKENNTALGIVSPCSSCANQRYISDPNGKYNVCPRRAWINQYTQQQNGTFDEQLEAQTLVQLTLTGTSSDPSLTTPLANPVYDSDGKSILVWIATFKDNRAILDVNGTLLNPSLSVGRAGFNTDYITCKPIPYTPNTDEHGYFLSGSLKEWETIQASENRDQLTDDGSAEKSIAGSVTRSSYVGSIPRQPVIADNSPSGT